MSMIEQVVQQARSGLHENDEARAKLDSAAEVAQKLNENVAEARGHIYRARELLQGAEYGQELLALLGNASLSAGSSAVLFEQATEGSILPSAEAVQEAAKRQKDTVEQAFLGAVMIDRAVEKTMGQLIELQNRVAVLYRLTDLFDLSQSTEKNQAVQAHGEQFIADLSGEDRPGERDFDFDF